MTASAVILHALGWALVHSLWQCALVALLLRLALAVSRSAVVRYWLCCGALALMLASLGATAWAAARGATTEGRAPASAAMVDAAAGGATVPAVAAGDAAGPLPAIVPTRVAATVRGAWTRASRGVERAFPLLVVLWAAGVAALSLRLAVGWGQAARMVRAAADPPPWAAACAERLRHRLLISRPVRLLTSTLVHVPVVVGWLRPVVLLPASALTGLTPRQIELLVLHELVHVRRHDGLVNLLQAAAETALFHHPAAWWVSRRIREEREHCCDDVAAGVAGVRDYVDALATMEELRARRPLLALAANGSPLLGRVARLVERRAAPPRRGYRAAALAGVLLLTVAALLVARQSPSAGDAADAPVVGAGDRRTEAPRWSSGCAPAADSTSTLCPELVRAAESALARRAEGGAVVVQEVATGAVLAHSAAGVDLREGAIPGSVWKLVLAAIAWEQGTSDDAAPCTETLEVEGRTVRNWGPHAERAPGIAEMLVVSCNTAAVRLALELQGRLGRAGFVRELERIGFPVAPDGGAPPRDAGFWSTSPVGFRERMSPQATGLAFEAGGAASWASLALATGAVHVTPLHLSRFLQALGNGGAMLAPTVDPRAAAAPGPPRRVLRPETAARMQAAMREVVRRGTAHGADRELEGSGWQLGGKTGTAPRAGGAGDGWFAGLVFDRSGAARYSIVVYLPRAGAGGGAPARLAAHLARQLPS